MKKNILTSILTAALISAAPSLIADEKVAYLGVATRELSDAMKTQLDLTNGIMVAHVAEESPASESLKEHDILTKFNDQLLMNPGQLTSLMKTLAKGDTVSIELVRIGKKETTEIVLGEIDAAKGQHGLNVMAIPGMGWDVKSMQLPGGIGNIEVLNGLPANIQGHQGFSIDGKAMNLMPGAIGNLDALKGLPADIQAKIDEAMAQAIEMKIDVENLDALKGLPADMQAKIDEAMKQVIEMNVEAGNPGAAVTSSTTSSTVWNEDGVTYKIVSKDKTKVVTILKGEELIFEGPANTKKEMKLIPEPYRKKLEDIQGKIGGASGIIINGIRVGEGKVGK